ncbi:MAG: glycosyltransferase [Nitrososphaerota archaeon]
MRKIKSSAQLAYITLFDPKSYRRPTFVKKSIPNVVVYYYSKVLDSNISIKRIYGLNQRLLTKIEAKIYPHPGSSGVLISALINNLINRVLLSQLPESIVFVLNPTLASRKIWGTRQVVVDWMDVWMWPWDQLNVFDIEAIKESDGVIFWSKPHMEIMRRRLSIKECTYIPHGIDLNEFDPTKVNPMVFRQKYGLNENFIVVYSGGIWSPYGVDLQGIEKLIKAVSLASKYCPALKLVLQLLRVDSSLIQLCKRLNVLNRTLFIGPLPYNSYERLNVFAAADLLVAPNSRHPTVYYAERIKFFQYMAAGKAILAEKTPGALSVFGDTAHYVNLDDVEAMADAIVELYENKDLRERLGRLARERVVRLFEWKILGEKLREFVNRILS